jgi:hypothetical protein
MKNQLWNQTGGFYSNKNISLKSKEGRKEGRKGKGGGGVCFSKLKKSWIWDERFF